ncbi:excalibur calcium-binding domain-containing protein [Phenylobacterium sp.]|uniref:excalibur calcium-binding domain-containing protein n=1 Tax=Phenylobacterium sp. TaxID=1871053 RepID=UPI0032C23CFA
MLRTAMTAAACALLLAAGGPGRAAAHPGGLNAEGCHNNRKTGGYHCHRGGAAADRPSANRSARASGARSAGGFPNCAAARAAGAAPVRRGDPGYGPHLDRDGTGSAASPTGDGETTLSGAAPQGLPGDFEHTRRRQDERRGTWWSLAPVCAGEFAGPSGCQGPATTGNGKDPNRDRGTFRIPSLSVPDGGLRSSPNPRLEVSAAA